MSSLQIDFPRPFSTRQIFRPIIPTSPWRPTRLKKLSSLSIDTEDTRKPIEYVTHMTQTDYQPEADTERVVDTATFWVKKRTRYRHGPLTRRTLSLPGDTVVSFLLTPTKSVQPSPPGRARLYSQLEARPTIAGVSYSVRGSGFRQRLPRHQLLPGPHFISLKEKLHTVVKGRRAVLNGTDKTRNKSVPEAVALAD